MLRLGDHLVSSRLLYLARYTHHGLVTALHPEIRVTHYSGFCEGVSSGPVVETSLEDFCAGRSYRVRPWRRRKFDGPASVERARQRLGENKYNVLTNNCEHFVRWCINDSHTSHQVRVASMGGTGGAVLAYRMAGRVVSRLVAPAAGTALCAAVAPVAVPVVGLVVGALVGSALLEGSSMAYQHFVTQKGFGASRATAMA